MSAGHKGDKIRASVGLPLEYRVGAPFDTIRHYMALLGFKSLKKMV